jgi:hypothetical protein
MALPEMGEAFLIHNAQFSIIRKPINASKLGHAMGIIM